MDKTVTLKHVVEVTLPGGVWINSRIKQDPFKQWDPEKIVYQITIRVDAPTEEQATLAFGDAHAAIREAFGG